MSRKTGHTKENTRILDGTRIRYPVGLSLGGFTGYAILPIKGKGSPDWAYAWVPIVGPLVGSILGTVIYLLYIAPLKVFL